MCVGRRARRRYCPGFLDVDGRWNNGFFCARRSPRPYPDTATRRRSSLASSAGGHVTGDHVTGCCGNETYRFCCDVTPSFRRHYNALASSSLSSTTTVDDVHRYQLVRCLQLYGYCYSMLNHCDPSTKVQALSEAAVRLSARLFHAPSSKTVRYLWNTNRKSNPPVYVVV